MIEFEIPGAPPLLLNSRMHHMAKNRECKKWKHWVWRATIGKKPSEPLLVAAVTYERFCGYQEPDYDNLVSGFKWVQDGLVEAGILTDDRRGNIESEYVWHKAAPKDKRIRVTIDPIIDPDL